VGARGTAALGLALVAAGAAFAVPSLYVPGFALAGVAILAAVWVWLATRGAGVDVEAGPTRIVEGDTYPLALALRRGPVPPPAGELDHPLLTGPVAVGPLRPTRVGAEIRFERRGRHRLACSWTIRDPLGLSSRRIDVDEGAELLVLPRVEPVMPPAFGGGGVGGGSVSGNEEGVAGLREARAVEFEIDGLRPYREGSPASRIHWPAVARSGEMHERRLVAGADARPLVVLDAARPDDEESLDRAVRAAASLCVHLAQSGGCSVLLPGHRQATALDSALRAWPQVHGLLALVHSGTPTFPPSRLGRHGSVVWVTAGNPIRGERLVAALGAGPHFVVSSRAHGRAAPALAVAGCHGRRVGARRIAVGSAA
jgi:uncharacterized protein (DUF58 family)